MARRRVNLKLVPTESARKVTFRKRKQGLMKKMKEITTLCGINACMVIYNPLENEPHIWPSREKAMEIMARYESIPMMDQEIKKVDHEKFMENRVNKLCLNIQKVEKRNKEIRASLILYQLTRGKTMEDLNIAELELLQWFSEVKMIEINRRNFLLPPIGIPSNHVPSQFSQQKTPPPPPRPSILYTPPFVTDPPPPSAFCPPPFLVQPPPPLASYPPPPITNQGFFIGGNAQNGENMMTEPPQYHVVENDILVMNLFGYGGDSDGVGTSETWQGESSNGNQQNNLDFIYGINSNPFPGFN